MSDRWIITAPIDRGWTPAEIAQISRAAQAFLAALPAGFWPLTIDGIGVLPPTVPVTWPQPSEIDMSPDSGLSEPVGSAAPIPMSAGYRYTIPGLSGEWLFAGSSTIDMGADGRVTLLMVRA